MNAEWKWPSISQNKRVRYARRADDLELYNSSTTLPVKHRHQPMSRFYSSCSRIVGGWAQAQPGKNALLQVCTLRAELQADAAPMLFAGCQNSTTFNSLHCSIRSKVVANCADVWGFDTHRAPRNCSRYVGWYYGFQDVLDSVYVPILLYCCTRIHTLPWR